MSRQFKIEMKIKGCDIVFKEELGKGVIASQIAEYPDAGKDGLIMMNLLDIRNNMIDEIIDVQIKEITNSIKETKPKLCNCMIKTPDPKYHKEDCPIRKGLL